MTDWKDLKECLCCGSRNLIELLDLGPQPLANSYLRSVDEEEQEYPLIVNYCDNCTHMQLSVAVNPDLMFREYLYVSGTSRMLGDYFNNFVNKTDSKNMSNNKVLDIACNDGTLLDIYKDLGYETFGIDPSVNLSEISSKNHTIHVDYLSDDHASLYEGFFGTITALHVMPHNSYPLEFLKIAKKMLAPGGRIYIQNSQANMIQNNEFDAIYHEHISYFTIKSFQTLCSRAGLALEEVELADIHGGSNLFTLRHDNEIKSKDFSERINIDLDRMKQYADSCKNAASSFAGGVNEYAHLGYKVIGYGAAAKGNTLLNFAKVDLEYIIDDNPLKQGLYTPGRVIPIVSSEFLAEENEKVCIVLLAWNFLEEIVDRVSKKSNALELIFVKPFPIFTKVVHSNNLKGV